MVCRIFIGGLPSAKTEKELRERFGKVGKLLDVWVSKPKSNGSGLPRNFGYLTFATEAEGERCKKVFNKTKWLGKRIRAETANPGYMERLRAKWAEEEKMKKPEIKTRKRKLPFQNFPPPKRQKGESDSGSELDSDSEPESDVVMETQNESSNKKCSIVTNNHVSVKGMEITEDIRCFLGSDSSDDDELDGSDISPESTSFTLDATENEDQRGEDNNNGTVKLNMENSFPQPSSSVLYEQQPKTPIEEHSAEVITLSDDNETRCKIHPLKNSFVYKDTHIRPEILPSAAEKPSYFPWAKLPTKPVKESTSNLEKKSSETNPGLASTSTIACVSCQQQLPSVANFCWKCGAAQRVQSKNEEENSLEGDATKKEEATTNDKLEDMEDDQKQEIDPSEYLSPVNKIIHLSPSVSAGPPKRGRFTLDFIVPEALSKKLGVSYSATPPPLNKATFYTTQTPGLPETMECESDAEDEPITRSSPISSPEGFTMPTPLNKSMCLSYTTQTPGVPEIMECESDADDEPVTKSSPLESTPPTPETTSTTASSAPPPCLTTSKRNNASLGNLLDDQSLGLWTTMSTMPSSPVPVPQLSTTNTMENPPNTTIPPASSTEPRSQPLHKVSNRTKKQHQRRALQKQQAPKLNTWSLLCKK